MRALSTALETGVFAPVYLFHGDDDFLKEEQVRALIERATDVATRDFNLEIRHGAEVEPGALGLTLGALPLMAARRVVVIRDVSALRKDARDVLLRYLERPAGDAVLILVAGQSAKADPALQRLTTAIEFSAMTDDEVTHWVLLRFAALGCSITHAAAKLLRRGTGNDLALLAGEIEKLQNYADGAEVDETTVSAVIGARAGESMGDLLDLVGVGDGAGATRLLEHVLAQPKATGVSLVMALTTQMLAIGWAIAARGLHARALPPVRLERDLYDLLGESRSSTVGRPWSEAVKGWVRATAYWDDASVDRALALLRQADASLKESRVSSEEQLLTSLLLAMTVGERGHVAA